MRTSLDENGQYGPLDATDARILLALDDDPEATILQLAGSLGLSRNTVHARLQRLHRDRRLLDFSQRVSPASLGYPMTAFVALSLDQSQGVGATNQLTQIPEIVEIHATSGDADLLITVVARGAEDLYRITKAMLGIPGVVRSSTAVSLSQVMPHRTRPLLELRAESRTAR